MDAAQEPEGEQGVAGNMLEDHGKSTNIRREAHSVSRNVSNGWRHAWVGPIQFAIVCCLSTLTHCCDT